VTFTGFFLGFTQNLVSEKLRGKEETASNPFLRLDWLRQQGEERPWMPSCPAYDLLCSWGETKEREEDSRTNFSPHNPVFYFSKSKAKTKFSLNKLICTMSFLLSLLAWWWCMLVCLDVFYEPIQILISKTPRISVLLE